MSGADEKIAKTELPTVSYAEKRKQKDEQRKVLDPDNPILERFQKALKDHLVRQIESLKQDIFGYETEASKKTVQKEELGVQVYNGQQIVAKQQEQLDICIKHLERATATRKENENNLEERRKVYQQERLKLIEAENEELRLKKEVESTNFLIYQMSKYENTIETNLTTKHRMLEKSNQEKTTLLKQKRAQDALIYRMYMKNWQMESEIEKTDMHNKLRFEEQEQMAQIVALGNANVEARATEYKNLTRAWNSVVLNIADRDRVVRCLNAELSKLEREFKNVLTDIDRLKRNSRKEMQKNELLTRLKNKAKEDIAHFTKQIEEEMAKKQIEEKQINEMQVIVDRTQADFDREEHEKFLVEAVHEELTKEFERLMVKKGALKDEISNSLANEMTNSCELKKLLRILYILRDETRPAETALVKGENEIQTVLYNQHRRKCANEQLEQHQKEIEERILELRSESQVLDKEVQGYQGILDRTGRQSEVFNAKLEKILEKAGGVETEDMEVTDLERDLVKLDKEVATLQEFWLIDQTHLIEVSKQRQDQIIAKNLLRKKTTMMEQKVLGLLDLINGHKASCAKVAHHINHLENKLMVMTEKKFKEKAMKDFLYKKNQKAQTECADKLKDVELSCLALQSEVDEIERDKVNLSKDLIEMHRESLEWEKIFTQAKDIQKCIKTAARQGGELYTLQSDNNKLSLRYSQLKKTQDKLMNELDYCIVRRDVIVTKAEARERRSLAGFEKTRFNFIRKMDNMRHRMKHIENETETYKEKIKHVDLELSSVGYDMDRMEQDIASDKSTLEGLLVDFEEAKTERQMTFELLLHLQKRLALCNEIAKGRKPYTVYKRDWELSAYLTKHKQMNAKLDTILYKLIQEFPCYEQELTRLLNTLRAPLLASKF